MKLHFLCTVSGLWQLPDRTHQSMIFEINGAMYVFDAGACCSRTIQLMRLDLLRIKKVIISHCHMDHIGGLGNLFWDIRKQIEWLKRSSRFGDVELYIPEMKTWEGWKMILAQTEGSIMVDLERAIANVRHHYEGNAMICEDASTIEFKLGGYRL